MWPLFCPYKRQISLFYFLEEALKIGEGGGGVGAEKQVFNLLWP